MGEKTKVNWYQCFISFLVLALAMFCISFSGCDQPRAKFVRVEIEESANQVVVRVTHVRNNVIIRNQEDLDEYRNEIDFLVKKLSEAQMKIDSINDSGSSQPENESSAQ